VLQWYDMSMFVRCNRNRSGTVSVQIINKVRGRYQLVTTVGCSADPDEVSKLYTQAKQYVSQSGQAQGQTKLLAVTTPSEQAVDTFIHTLSNEQIHTIGPELIYGTLFDRLGFGTIPHKLFRHLVLARLAYPASKLETVDYLYRYRGIHVAIDDIYRFLDTLAHNYQTRVEQIAFTHTLAVCGGTIAVVFYDLTTLYFEAEHEDDLRRIGFNKDGKHQQPQIVLGLLVTTQGYPLGYELFEGNTFEGHTLIPAIERLTSKYHLDRPVVVADAGLLSLANQEALAEKGYRYILGSKLKNESEHVKRQVLQLTLSDTQTAVIQKAGSVRLVVSYTTKRAIKDRHNREKGLQRLEKKVRTGKLSKSHVNNRGYNKYLKLEGKVSLSIDYEKFKQDGKWDGLKGYVTNTDLDSQTIIAHYTNLWQIEKAFRISKTDLRIRPIYHYKRHRIEAHLAITFTAYTIFKELERLLSLYHVPLSPYKAAKLTHTMYAITYIHPQMGTRQQVILHMNKEQQSLYDCVMKVTT
jgi:transposase